VHANVQNRKTIKLVTWTNKQTNSKQTHFSISECDRISLW